MLDDCGFLFIDYYAHWLGCNIDTGSCDCGEYKWLTELLIKAYVYDDSRWFTDLTD